MTACKVRYVGLDVHKRVVEACFVDAAGKVLWRERFALERRVLELFAGKFLQPTDQMALEATTNCWAVADVLRPHVARVVVSNPLLTKAIAQAKVKTDKVDAQVLAQLLRCDYLPEVWQPDEATRRLRELTSRRSALVGQRTALRNRIHSVLAMRLVTTPNRLFSLQGMAWLRELLASGRLDGQAVLLIQSDLRQLDFLQQEIDAVEEELARRGYAQDKVKLLMTLPGVDVTTAEALLAAWGDARRFPDGDHAASYLGLVPSTRQSAERCYHGPITKRGRSQARWMLVEAAQHLDRHPGPLGHFFRRLMRKKNRNVAVVAAARKLAVIAWRMLTSGEPYRYALPRSTETKLARLRVKATGKRRKGGAAKGTKCVPKLPGGSRTIRSLAQVCQSEGLPAPKPLSPGEQRVVRQTGCVEFVRQIANQQIVPRRGKTTSAGGSARTSSGGRPARTSSAGGSAETSSGPRRGKTSSGPRKATRARQPGVRAALRRPRAGEQGDESPPPAPPTLSSVPEQGRTMRRSKTAS